MANDRKLIHCLLVLCIGLMPAYGLGASESQHVDHAPSDCLDCNPAETASGHICEDESCVQAAHTCGSIFYAGFVPENLANTNSQSVRLVNSLTGETRFRSRLAESIYRPPIS